MAFNAGKVQALFDSFDPQGDGILDREALSQILLFVEPDQTLWTDGNIDRVLESAAPGCKGQVRFQQFLAWVFSADASTSFVINVTLSSGGNLVDVAVESQWTGTALKAVVSRLLTPGLELCELLLNGRSVGDNRTVADLGMVSGSTLLAIIRDSSPNSRVGSKTGSETNMMRVLEHEEMSELQARLKAADSPSKLRHGLHHAKSWGAGLEVGTDPEALDDAQKPELGRPAGTLQLGSPGGEQPAIPTSPSRSRPSLAERRKMKLGDAPISTGGDAAKPAAVQLVLEGSEAPAGAALSRRAAFIQEMAERAAATGDDRPLEPMTDTRHKVKAWGKSESGSLWKRRKAEMKGIRKEYEGLSVQAIKQSKLCDVPESPKRAPHHSRNGRGSGVFDAIPEHDIITAPSAPNLLETSEAAKRPRRKGANKQRFMSECNL